MTEKYLRFKKGHRLYADFKRFQDNMIRWMNLLKRVPGGYSHQEITWTKDGTFWALTRSGREYPKGTLARNSANGFTAISKRSTLYKSIVGQAQMVGFDHTIVKPGGLEYLPWGAGRSGIKDTFTHKGVVHACFYADQMPDAKQFTDPLIDELRAADFYKLKEKPRP